jgi:hypothetical protein
VRWRTGDTDDDPAVLAARRFVALQYTVASVPEPPDLVPLFATVAADDITAIYTKQITNPLPPDRRELGPRFGWVAAVSPGAGGTTQVDVCQDAGWSGLGGAPQARRIGPQAIRYAVTDSPAGWKVSGIALTDPEPETVRRCEAWGAAHTSPDSPA